MKTIKFTKRISSLLLTVAMVFLCCTHTSFAGESTTTSSSGDSVEITIVDGGESNTKIASETVPVEELNKNCMSQISSGALKSIDISGIVLKAFGTITVYGGAAKLFSDVFYPEGRTYFIIGGMLLGILSPVARNIYKQLNKTQKEALRKVVESIITSQVAPKLL